MTDLIGLFLWRQSYTERIAVGTFARLIRSPLLTGEEKMRADGFMWEEMDHADCLRARARAYVRDRPEQWPGFTPARLPDHLALATTYIGERLMAPGFGLVVRAFVALGDRETARLYERIEIEETPHIAWGRAVLQRLRKDQQIAQDVRAFMRSRHVVSAYKRVAPDQRWIGQYGRLRAAALDQSAQVVLDVGRQVERRLGSRRPALADDAISLQRPTGAFAGGVVGQDEHGGQQRHVQPRHGNDPHLGSLA